MGMKKIFLVMVLLFLPFIYGDVYKPNENVFISTYCLINNTPCSSASCNVTFLNDPNGVNILIDEPMNYVNGSYFEYNRTGLVELGVYNYGVYCSQGAGFFIENKEFIINKRGDSEDIDFLMWVFVALHIVIILFFLYLKTNAENKYISFACMFYASLEFMMLLGMIYVLLFGGLVDILVKINFYMLGLTFMGVLFWKLVELIIDLLEIQKMNKNKKDGWEEEEKW